MLGKVRRKPFTEVEAKQIEPLYAVSIDTTGPINLADHNGNVYLQLLVDTTSGFKQGFPIKKKGDAAGVILKSIRRLELSVGTSLKQYNSDNAKEQRKKALLEAL